MNLFAIAGLSCAISCIVLSLLTVVFGKTKLQRLLLCFNMVVAVWGVGLFLVGIAENEPKAILGWQIAHLGGFFIGTFFYHMVCVFCEIQRRKLIYFAYIQAILFNILNFGTNHLFTNTRFVFGIYYNDVTLLLVLGILSYLSLVFLSYVELSRFLKKTKGYKRTQTLYIIFAFMIGFVGGTSTFLPEFRIDLLYPFGNFGITLYCLIVSYAILRYRLMDIKLVFRKSMVYSLSAGILTSLFVVLVLAMTKFLSYVAGISSFAITVIAALIIAFLFNPLKNKIQSFIDKSFYKKSYDYYPTIREISRRLTSIFDLDEVFSYVGNVIYSTLGLTSIYLLLPAPGKGFEVVYHKLHKPDKHKKIHRESVHSEGQIEIRKNSEIVQYFKKSDDILVKDELPGLERKLGEEIIERINGELRPFDGEAAVPVFSDKKLILLFILGEKLSGDMFTHEDINLLNIVSNQVTIAVKNALLYKDKVHTERLASIGMMSATFAHEIRNPLTSLKTFAQLMPEKYNDEEFRDTFSKIVVREIDRINSLINDLLDFSTEKQGGRVNEFNLKLFMDEILEYIKGRLEVEKQNILIEKVYNNVKINLDGDMEKLKQAFINILNNGCQAMNGEGVLKVEIKPNARNVDIVIEDTGEGIHPDDLPKIFDPFVTTKEMGVGLGLAISKRVIEDHKGKIRVKSKLSQGTTFTVSLPMQNA